MEPKGALKRYPEVCYKNSEILLCEFQCYQKHTEFLNISAVLKLKVLWKGKGEVYVGSFETTKQSGFGGTYESHVDL